MMNRETKYRAWIKDICKMIHVESIYFDGYNGFEVSGEGYCDLDHLEVDLLQFTGLKDKNEVDIYEGDVIIITGHGVRQPFEVRYFAPSFHILCVPTNVHIPMSSNSEYEIIGNIHQNPELL